MFFIKTCIYFTILTTILVELCIGSPFLKTYYIILKVYLCMCSLYKVFTLLTWPAFYEHTYSFYVPFYLTSLFTVYTSLIHVWREDTKNAGLLIIFIFILLSISLHYITHFLLYHSFLVSRFTLILSIMLCDMFTCYIILSFTITFFDVYFTDLGFTLERRLL